MVNVMRPCALRFRTPSGYRITRVLRLGEDSTGARLLSQAIEHSWASTI